MRFIAPSVLPKRCLSWRDEIWGGPEPFQLLKLQHHFQSKQLKQKTTSGKSPPPPPASFYPSKATSTRLFALGSKGRQGGSCNLRQNWVNSAWKGFFCLPVACLPGDEYIPSPSPLYSYSELICCSGSCTATSRAGKHICIVM